MFVHFVLQVSKTFCYSGAKRAEHRGPEHEVVRVIVPQVVRTVVRTVVSAVVRIAVVVVEHPRGRQAPKKKQPIIRHHNLFLQFMQESVYCSTVTVSS